MGTNNIHQLCRSLANSYKSSHLQVEANGVTWLIVVSNGQLQYATHSLQTIDNLVHHLASSGNTLSALQHKRLASAMASGAWNLKLWNAIDQLQQQGVLTIENSRIVKLALSKEALEPLLWLPEAQISSSPPQHSYTDLLPLKTVLDELEPRLQSWQKLQPVIISPHQQITCPDKTRLKQPVANGRLNQALLSMLAQLMQDISICQVAFLLKQDILKVAQLLYPYIQQRVFVVTPPVFPFKKLPTIPKPAISPQPRQTSSISKAEQRYKIVCIDDSPAMLDILRKYLEADGFDVATLDNPMESMSMLFSMKPDMILMDVSMPGINGRRLCEILRRSSAFKNLPIIIVSSNSGILNKVKAESAGATAYLQKPFSKMELLTIVKTYLRAVSPV